MHEKSSMIYGETLSPEPPRPSRIIYNVLARHVTANGADTHEVLNDVYKAIGDTEYAADVVLEALERSGVLEREDVLVLVVTLAVSRTLGPDLAFLRRAIMEGAGAMAGVREMVAQSGLDPVLAHAIQEIVSKIQKTRGV
jgi:hypothetical protein